MYEQTDRNRDGERDFYRQILIVAIKDAISIDNKKYASKYRHDALRWFTSKKEVNSFCFNKVIEFVFGDNVDREGIRDRILKLIENKKVSGVKNLSNIFQGMDDE